MSVTGDETIDHLSLRGRVYGTLQAVNSPYIDTDLIFEKVEAALRKKLKLSFAQCDDVLADIRDDIMRMIGDELGRAINFREAVSAIEDLIDEELDDGDGDGGSDDPLSPPRLRVIK